MNLPFVFERLQSHHDRTAFDCGNPALNNFLAKQARQNADRNVGVTHVVVDQPGSTDILGYYTLVTRTIARELVPKSGLPRGDIGVVLLGRLAIAKKAQGQGLGKLCLLRAMHQVARAAEEIGIHALVLNAKDKEARAWYLHLDFGFESLLDDPNHLYLPVETIRRSIGKG